MGRIQHNLFRTSVALVLCASPVLAEDDAHPDRLTDEYKPLVSPVEENRPRPLIELGDPYLETGPIQEGFELPGGAVWQPSLTVFGTYRTAVQAFDDGDDTLSEWVHRLDLFANLKLSGTERVLVGIRPLDEDGRFTGINFEGAPTGFEDEYNVEITTLFFEGELGELFPQADPHDRRALDIGFSVGRQEIAFQEGMLINDRIDAVGLTRNNVLPSDFANVRHTFLYGWNELHRDDNLEDRSIHLFGLFNQIETAMSTIDIDMIYILDPGEDTSGFYWGASTVQRVGHFNTSFRALGSYAVDDESEAVSDGHLFFAEVSWTPAESDDLVYMNIFWGIDNFSSASRGPDRGGPLGRTGILFEAVELGRYGSALSNRADRAFGGAVGYQAFFDDMRKQLIIEFGGRSGTIGEDDAAIALGGRYRQAIGQQWEFQIDLIGSLQEFTDPGWGTRFAIRYEF